MKRCDNSKCKEPVYISKQTVKYNGKQYCCQDCAKEVLRRDLEYEPKQYELYPLYPPSHRK